MYLEISHLNLSTYNILLSFFPPYPPHSDNKKEHNIDAINDFGVPMKRPRMTPPLNERVMLYVRQDNEDVYTPLHVVPPTQMGLLNAVSYHTFF